MAKVVDGELVIFEGDVYQLEGDTLVFIEGGDEDGKAVGIVKERETLH